METITIEIDGEQVEMPANEYFAYLQSLIVAPVISEQNNE